MNIGDIITDVYCNQNDCVSCIDNKCQRDFIVLDDIVKNGMERINEFKCRSFKIQKGENNE
ncbi:hypothetical protein DSECCO2_655680 [anaerobic digester metagenome]